MIPTPIKATKPSPLFTLPESFRHPSIINVKRTLLACFALAAYIAWSLGAWEAFLIGTGLRPKLRPTVLLAGDSLTEKGTNPKSNGWVTLLQNDYTRSANVVPRGLSGYNTRWYLKYAMPVIREEIVSGSYTPVLITLWLGANDAALPNGSNSEQHVPIETYRQNLITIVREFQTLAPDSKIILITPPHVDDMARHRRARNNEGDKKGVIDRTNEMAGKYAQVCVETAHKLGLPVVNLYSYFNDMPKWRRNNMLGDGLHLSTRGNRLMYDQLMDKIKSEFPDVVHKLERWQAPNFNRLVKSDPWIPDNTDDGINSTRTLRSTSYLNVIS
ncbi:GDSL-like Lipase/Acylhydrolase family [Phytophthora infestans]|uniref:GDSL-like Lipase/Acylhydrolase family n=1 Tax=Phytophthora infestans TaxID=4787 RepID=A0A833T7K4_PHYIN|nr:GDSL-like Lipase/Acylhydrolase family [Phytophthora infestans]